MYELVIDGSGWKMHNLSVCFIFYNWCKFIKEGGMAMSDDSNGKVLPGEAPKDPKDGYIYRTAEDKRLEPSEMMVLNCIIEPKEWSMSKEREFMENLLCQRFNFLLVVFSIILAGAGSANTQQSLIGILGTGSVVCFLLTLTVYRVHIKHHWIVKALYLVKGHAVSVNNASVQKVGIKKLFSVSRLIGIYIPMFCCLVLIAGVLLAVLGVLKAG